MELGDVIRIRRRELDLTLEDIATACGVGKSIVSKWEHGDVTNLRRNNIESLADVLRVSPLVILGREELDGSSSPYIPEGFQPLPEMAIVPRVGQIACGQPILAEEHITDYDQIPAAWRADFTLICKGDSMEPLVHDGDLVAVRKQPDVENGQIAAVRVGDDATLKVVRKHPQFVELKPINSAHDSIFIYPDNPDGIAIEGLAVGYWHPLVE